MYLDLSNFFIRIAHLYKSVASQYFNVKLVMAPKFPQHIFPFTLCVLVPEISRFTELPPHFIYTCALQMYFKYYVTVHLIILAAYPMFDS